jgi:hypothetical protein
MYKPTARMQDMSTNMEQSMYKPTVRMQDMSTNMEQSMYKQQATFMVQDMYNSRRSNNMTMGTFMEQNMFRN